jgi:hypothetical protein
VQTPDVPHYIRTKIKELLTYYPSGILGSRFCEAYFRHFHSNLDPKKLGFSMLQDLLNSLPIIAKIVNIKGGGYRVHGKTTFIHVVWCTCYVRLSKLRDEQWFAQT